jgi:tetratricopeptide (TPR) repeat protein
MRTSPPFAVLAATLLAACSLESAPGAAPRAARAPSPPVEKAPTIAAQLAACAAAAPDAGALRAALQAGRFAELEAELDELLAAYKTDPGCEERVWSALHALAQAELPALDRWVAERGDSWAAVTARAGHWLDVGYASRGVALARDVTDEQWEGMRRAFARTEPDLRRAVELRPDAFVAYGYAIRMLKLSAGGEREWLAALLAHDPLNHGVRQRAMEALEPKWGGSIEEMEEIAEEALPYAGRNPQLRSLPGWPIVERARMAWWEDDLAAATAGYRRALAYGDHWSWHNGLAKLLDKQQQWKALKAEADAWLALEEHDSAPWMWRGRAYMGLGNPSAALEDFERGLARSPEDPYLVRWRGYALGKLGRLEESLAAYERALALQPDDAWTIDQLEKTRARLGAQAQGGGTLPALSRLGLASEGSKGEDR